MDRNGPCWSETATVDRDYNGGLLHRAAVEQFCGREFGAMAVV